MLPVQHIHYHGRFTLGNSGIQACNSRSDILHSMCQWCAALLSHCWCYGAVKNHLQSLSLCVQYSEIICLIFYFCVLPLSSSCSLQLYKSSRLCWIFSKTALRTLTKENFACMPHWRHVLYRWCLQVNHCHVIPNHH